MSHISSRQTEVLEQLVLEFAIEDYCLKSQLQNS